MNKNPKKPFVAEPLRMQPSDMDKVEEALNRRTLVQAKVVRRVKGGLVVQVANTNAFLPHSLVDTHLVRDLDPYVGKTLNVHVVRFSPQAGVLTVGRRSVIELQMGEERMKLMDSLKVGVRIEGVVSAMTDYGAFVDVGGLQGLVPLSAWSSKPGKHPSEFVSPGEMVQVTVKAISKDDLGRTRISLSKPTKI